MKKLFLALAAVFLVACGKPDDVKEVAKEFAMDLNNGDVSKISEYAPDMPKEMIKEAIACLGQEKKRNGGVKSVQISRVLNLGDNMAMVSVKTTYANDWQIEREMKCYKKDGEWFVSFM